jgi:hypothetical protein
MKIFRQDTILQLLKRGYGFAGEKYTIFCWMDRYTFSLNLLLSPSASVIAISDDALGDFILCFKM